MKVKRVQSDLIFFGNDQAFKKMQALRDQLDLAMSLQSGLQQGMNVNSEEYQMGEFRIKCAVRDIAAGVLGLDIDFGSKLPYPALESTPEFYEQPEPKRGRQ